LTFFSHSGKKKTRPLAGKENLTLTLQNAAAAPGAVREGLPYWIFWLLLCLILLLLAFIFLRDKDLRRRLNIALSAAKRRVKRATLGLRIKREKRRRGDLQAELGRRAWTGRVGTARFETHFRDIEGIEAAVSEHQSSLTRSRAQRLVLRERQEEVRRRLKGLRKERDAGESVEAGAFRDARRDEANLRREVKALGKRIDAGQSEVRRLEREKNARLAALGEVLDKVRYEDADFAALYAQIDMINRRIQAAIDQMDKLK
jgi:chromosome segregation ATPase